MVVEDDFNACEMGWRVVERVRGFDIIVLGSGIRVWHKREVIAAYIDDDFQVDMLA